MTKVYIDYIPQLTHFIAFHALVVICDIRHSMFIRYFFCVFGKLKIL